MKRKDDSLIRLKKGDYMSIHDIKRKRKKKTNIFHDKEDQMKALSLSRSASEIGVCC
jgi:hypothetical protein